MKTANLIFPHGLFLAPMAGVTDIPFRYMCRKYGAEGVFTEMISSRALCFHDAKTALLASITSDEHPCFLQLFGNDPALMARAAQLALDFKPDGIDINMGCPAPKIAGNGDGSALMKSPEKAYEIVREVKAALDGTGLPLSVKMRAGFDAAHKNAVRVAELCEKAGVDFLTVHGRTREQMYAPPVDLDSIREVKRSVGVPVIANGDITDAATALRTLEYTGCDGLMIGRGALGNPYIFDEITHALDGVPYSPPSREQKRQDVTEHMTRLIELKGECAGAREARKHVAWYIKGVQGAAVFRDEVNHAVSLDEVLDVIARAFA